MQRELWRETPASVKLLLIISFMMNIGFYALIPYLTLYLTGSFAWTVAMAGMLLGVRQFSQQGLAFLGGMVADKFGYKGTMVLGTAVRATGFLLFAFCHETWHFIGAAILSGLGGALFEPAGAAAFAILTPEKIRKEVFAFRNVLSNIGIVGSQIIGIVLSTLDFFWLSVFAGGIYYVSALVTFFFLPAVQSGNQQGSMASSIGLIFRDKPFIRYTLILIGYYYIYMQMFLGIPQFTEDLLNSKTYVGTVLATVSVSIILFQMKVTHWLENYNQRFTLIGIGALIMGMGLFLFSFASSLWMLLFDVFIFALGTMVSMPYLVDMVPRFAPKEHIGAYYGFNGYSLAIGGSVGTTLGGWVYDMGKATHMPWLPWSICLLVGGIVAWNLYRMEFRVGGQFYEETLPQNAVTNQAPVRLNK
ncbi:MDR family MFS transporter [Brevibacillus sp. SYSU BS000544]|uniref:MDR family MFS transporter n=1 Tax=Brevibacillus sp. SYSU BS000544 TaxID=3416443 RepID=UPI003CE510DF